MKGRVTERVKFTSELCSFSYSTRFLVISQSCAHRQLNGKIMVVKQKAIYKKKFTPALFFFHSLLFVFYCLS